MDERAAHYRKMKQALWLFCYLVINANRKTGTLSRKVQTICSDMGLERDTILRWLKTLREGDYIATKSNGRCLAIQVKKWKPARGIAVNSPQPEGLSTISRGAMLTSQTAIQTQNIPSLSPNFVPAFAPNERSKKRGLLKIDIEKKKAFLNRVRGTPGYQGASREELLAHDLAEGLEDLAGIALYRSYANKYPERLLRQVFATIMQIPAKHIKKSRGALFNYLIKKHDQPTTDRSGR